MFPDFVATLYTVAAKCIERTTLVSVSELLEPVISHGVWDAGAYSISFVSDVYVFF
jgi:hypothetical protein